MSPPNTRSRSGTDAPLALGFRCLRLGRRQLPTPAGVYGNMPRHLAMRALRTLPDPAISGVSPDLLLLAVQKLDRRRQVVNVPSRWCTSPWGLVPICSFISKCRRFPFLVRCISGSRTLLSFLVDDGAEMMVASTILPSFSRSPPARPGAPVSGGSLDRRLVRNLLRIHPGKAPNALHLTEQVIHRRRQRMRLDCSCARP